MIVVLAWLGLFPLVVFGGYLGYKFGPATWPVGGALGFLYAHFVLLAVM